MEEGVITPWHPSGKLGFCHIRCQLLVGAGRSRPSLSTARKLCEVKRMLDAEAVGGTRSCHLEALWTSSPSL